MDNSTKQDSTKSKPTKNQNSYLKYTSMAFQLGGIILVGTLAGRWLDGRLALQTPVCTIVLSLLSVAAGLYVSLKDFIQPR